jgi:hypothetical protein
LRTAEGESFGYAAFGVGTSQGRKTLFRRERNDRVSLILRELLIPRMENNKKNSQNSQFPP